MNIDDKMRDWQNTRDGGGAGDLRRALGEAMEQVRLGMAGDPAPAGEPGPGENQAKADDLTAAHYLEVCATVEAIRGTVEAHQKAGRKRMDLKVLENLLRGKA